MPMKIYTDAITLQSQKPRQIFNITTQVKAAMEKSGLRDGIILVSSLHPNSALIVNDNEPGLLQDLDKWLAEIAPQRDDYAHHGRFESNASVHFQSLLLSHQVVVPFTETRLDLGPGQFVQFVELDGLRPRRILVKVIGE
ncbi:MAG TPA: secondary thiamine-phosphate synthase enzyme YjbQ [Candidatus Acidoferrales bacterium]|nr:secondary thiamine-phosphate synthase enzyme YjbQ [Candidatus Acidoferrales bacterium]